MTGQTVHPMRQALDDGHILTGALAAAALILIRFVPGTPAPQGSVKAFANKKTGRPIIVKDNKIPQKTWREDVRAALTDDDYAPLAHFPGAVAIELRFVMKRPAATPKTRATPAATKKPDLDKLVRAVFDAITSAGVWTDDSAVVDLHATKRLAELGEPTGCRIAIRDTAAVQQLSLEDAS